MERTPLYDEHIKLGARMVDFAGWDMPVFYTSIKEEHHAVRNKAGLFDICHMGELFVKGKDAKRFLQKIMTNNLDKLEPGKCMYSVMCYLDGSPVDDLFVYLISKGLYMLVVNASNITKDINWLKNNVGTFDVDIEDKSDNVAKIDIQGPNAEKILGKAIDFDLKKLARFHFIGDNIFGGWAYISRTGYTGEDGFELYLDASRSADVWKRLLEHGKELGMLPSGLGARDSLRLEAGYSLYGHELNKDINPVEAGISFVIDFEKEFIGKFALMNSFKRKIVCFEMIDKAVPRAEYKIWKDDKDIGYITSGTISPTFEKGIGMAILDKSTKVGDNIDVEIRGKLYKALVVERPIYKFKGGRK